MDWIPIQGFPGYSVNPLGQVRNDHTGRILAVKVNQYGLAYVGMMRNWDQHQRSLALLVARAFLPATNEIFNTPINLNGDRLDCSIYNLMWRPRWFARKYHSQFKYPPRRRINAPLRAIGAKEVFRDSFDAATRYGLLERDVVRSVLSGSETWPTQQVFELV